MQLDHLVSSSQHRQARMSLVEMTGWLSGQVFLQTVDDKEVTEVTDFLNSRGIPFQVLTLSERMQVDPTDPASAVSTDRFSIAVQIAGFPQVVSPVLDDLVSRAHGGGWDAQDASGA
jgi:hypothetical protein